MLQNAVEKNSPTYGKIPAPDVADKPTIWHRKIKFLRCYI